MKRIIFSIIILLFCVFHLHAQSVVINEVMARNAATIADEDGDYSDWIELYNPGDQSVNLEGFALSDDPGDPFKWVFPVFDLDAHRYLVIFSSGKDRKTAAVHWETVIGQGDIWKYSPGSASIGNQWPHFGYDDASWSSGPGGFGYGDQDDSTVVNPTVSLYIRKPFQIDAVSGIQLALLHMDYDDAFVAYINGTEVARSNIGHSGVQPGYDQTADASHEAKMYSGGLPEVFIIEQVETVFRQGQNVLAVQVHNAGPASSDLTVISFLTLGMSQAPPDPLGVTDPIRDIMPTFHTGFKISAGGETLVLSDDTGNRLDSIVASAASADISLGREPDGGNHWVWFAEPTPGSSNITVWAEAIAGRPQFSVSGGVVPEGTV
ncbi:lamin tail domain-containing protein, partial [bacterium]|nr:lamin tail domain-containing protein [bacterium]